MPSASPRAKLWSMTVTPHTPCGPLAGQRRLAALEHWAPGSPTAEDAMPDRRPSRTELEEEERRARNRLAVFRAKLYARPEDDTPSRRQRLAELERRWKSAAERLRQSGR
jgi:hypothetical protein